MTVGFGWTFIIDGLSYVAVLAGARLLRTYRGYRPYSPDHLPVIGEDPRTSGLWHATGHEGAGIGLSVGTAKLLVQAMTGQPTELPLTPFAPDRPTLAPAPTGVPT